MGFIQNIYLAPGIQVIKEPGVADWSKLLGIELDCYFRNNWTLTLKAKYGSTFEIDTHYISKDIDFWVWGTDSKTYNTGFGFETRNGFVIWCR